MSTSLFYRTLIYRTLIDFDTNIYIDLMRDL